VIALQAVTLVLVALGAPAVVLTRDPVRQAVVVGLYGLVLAVLYLEVQAPDVSLSQIVISTVGLPIMILLAVAKIREHEHERDRDGDG
jgi:energy-converting hydrogenase B subunit D